MKMTLIKNTGQTRIMVSRKLYEFYADIIASYIAAYGGKRESENSRYLYFIVDADLLAIRAEQAKNLHQGGHRE